MIVVTLFIAGLAVGIISTVLGIGGGVIVIPLLYEIMPNLPIQSVVGTSLGMVFTNALLNLYHFSKDGKKPDLKLALLTSVPIILGAFLGTKLSDTLSPRTIKIFIACLIAMVAFKLAFSKDSIKKQQEQWQPALNLKHYLLTGLTAFSAGVIIALTGIGGGVILIPFFLIVHKMPFNWVPIYSNIGMGSGAMMTLIALMLKEPPKLDLGWMQSFQIGYINWALIFFLLLGAFLSAKKGIQIGKSLDPKLAKKVFGALLGFIAGKILWSVF